MDFNMLEKVFNFYKKSPDDDVVISTYARLARNLSSFPFPVKYFQNDLEKMTDIFSNAFKNLEYDEKFHYLNYFLFQINLSNKAGRFFLNLHQSSVIFFLHLKKVFQFCF